MPLFSGSFERKFNPLFANHLQKSDTFHHLIHQPERFVFASFLFLYFKFIHYFSADVCHQLPFLMGVQSTEEHKCCIFLEHNHDKKRIELRVSMSCLNLRALFSQNISNQKQNKQAANLAHLTLLPKI